MPIQVLSQTFAARVFVIAEATNGREALLQEEMDARSFIPHAHTPRTCAVCAELPMSTPKQSPDQSPVRTEDAHLERKCDAQAQLEPQNERVPLVTPKKSRTESVDRPEFSGPCDAPPPLGARRPLPSLAAQGGLLREVEGEQRRTRYVGWLQFLFHRHQLRCLVAHEREVSENKALADSILRAVRQLSAAEEQVSALRDVQEEGKLLAEGAPVEGGSSSQVDAAEVQAPGDDTDDITQQEAPAAPGRESGSIGFEEPTQEPITAGDGPADKSEGPIADAPKEVWELAERELVERELAERELAVRDYHREVRDYHRRVRNYDRPAVKQEQEWAACYIQRLARARLSRDRAGALKLRRSEDEDAEQRAARDTERHFAGCTLSRFGRSVMARARVRERRRVQTDTGATEADLAAEEQERAWLAANAGYFEDSPSPAERPDTPAAPDTSSATPVQSCLRGGHRTVSKHVRFAAGVPLPESPAKSPSTGWQATPKASERSDSLQQRKGSIETPSPGAPPADRPVPQRLSAAARVELPPTPGSASGTSGNQQHRASEAPLPSSGPVTPSSAQCLSDAARLTLPSASGGSSVGGEQASAVTPQEPLTPLPQVAQVPLPSTSSPTGAADSCARGGQTVSVDLPPADSSEEEPVAPGQRTALGGARARLSSPAHSRAADEPPSAVAAAAAVTLPSSTPPLTPQPSQRVQFAARATLPPSTPGASSPEREARTVAAVATLPSTAEPEAEPEALPEPEAKALAPDSQCLAVAVQTPLPPSPPAPDPGWVGHTARRRSPSVDWALEMRLASLLSDEAAGRGALMEDASDAHSHLEQVADLRRAALRAVAAERFAAAQAVAEGRAAVIVAAMEAVSFHAVSVELPPTPPGEVIRWWTGMPIAITAATRMQRLGRALDCRRKVTVLRKHARLAAVYCIQRIARAGRVRSVFQSLLAALSASRDRASKAPLPDSPEEKDPLDLSQRRRASLWMEPRTPVKRGDEMSGGSDGGSPTPSPAGSPRASRWRSARKSSFASLLLRGSRASKRGSRSHPGSPHLVQHDERPIFSQPPTPVSGHVELDDEHSLLLRRSLSGHETRNVPLAKPPVRRSLTASPSARPNLRGAGLSGCSTLIVHVPKMWRLPVGVQGRYKQEGDKPLWTNQRGFRLLQGAGFWLITLSEARGSALLRSLGRIQPGQTPNQVPSWAYPASDSHSTPVAIGPSSSGWRR
eukprot:Hpha_TRINITY_DN15896_c2_g3::TRINITY_DN15896_c2_g3_i4::g.191969::m.191969